MKFHLENIACIEKADIELGDLTIICGDNNTGKTFIAHALYYYFKLRSLYRFKNNDFYIKNLPTFFSANSIEFKDFRFESDITTVVGKPFILTAERESVLLFQKELDASRYNFITSLTKAIDSNNDIDNMIEFMRATFNKFELAISENIDFVRGTSQIIKQNSCLKENASLITYVEKILNVQYEIINGQVLVINKTANRTIPIYMASASVKSLFSLHLWLKHKVQQGDTLFIDEPELNLHPATQRKMARLFVRLIKAGIKVFVTTHSDYIIKELNNLIILSHQFEDRESIMKKYKYSEEDVLDKSQVKAYIAEKNTLIPDSIDETGIEISNFDTEIKEMNDFYDDVLFGIGK